MAIKLHAIVEFPESDDYRALVLPPEKNPALEKLIAQMKEGTEQVLKVPGSKISVNVAEVVGHPDFHDEIVKPRLTEIEEIGVMIQDGQLYITSIPRQKDTPVGSSKETGVLNASSTKETTVIPGKPQKPASPRKLTAQEQNLARELNENIDKSSSGSAAGDALKGFFSGKNRKR